MRPAAGFQGAALAQLLQRTIENERYPLSPRLVLLKAVAPNLQPTQSQLKPCPPLKPGDADELLPRPTDDPRQRRCRQGPADRVVSQLRLSGRARRWRNGGALRPRDDRHSIGTLALLAETWRCLLLRGLNKGRSAARPASIPYE